MASNRIFQIALLVSVIAHAIILFQNSNRYTAPPKEKKENLEVSYVKPSQEPRKAGAKQDRPLKREPLLKMPPRMSLEKSLPLKLEKATVPPSINLIKPAFVKLDVIAINKKTAFSPHEAQRINNPAYLNYCQAVYEKIKHAVTVNYAGKELGEVSVSFVISRDGYLKGLTINEEESSASAFLMEIASKSIEDSSPFSPFPKELDYTLIPFNIIIISEEETE